MKEVFHVLAMVWLVIFISGFVTTLSFESVSIKVARRGLFPQMLFGIVGIIMSLRYGMHGDGWIWGLSVVVMIITVPIAEYRRRRYLSKLSG